MKYRLKDRELQRKLDALSDVNQFSGCFQTACERQFRNLFNFVRVEFGRVDTLDGSDVFTHVFFILKSDIEEYEEYNPKAWNQFPDVEPPEGVCMRLNIYRSNTREQHLYRKSAKFIRGAWRSEEGEEIYLEELDDVLFRPWDDEE